MNVKVDLSKLNIENEVLKTHMSEVEKSLDELWSDKDKRNKWVKTPMGVTNEQIEEIMMTALAAQDTCGLFVVIGNGGLCQSVKGVIEIVDNKSETAPEIEFVGENISLLELERLVEKMRHYEVNMCVMSKSGETLETIVAYKFIKAYMEKRYGKQLASKRIMVMTGDGENSLKKIAKESGSGVFRLSDEFVGNYSVLSPASLLIMAIAGIEIDRFLSGAEVMATDPCWDIDGGFYPIARQILKNNGRNTELISFSDDRFRGIAIWMANLLMESGSKKEDSILVMPYDKARDFKSKSEFLKENQKRLIVTEIGREKADKKVALKEIVRGSEDSWTSKDIDIISEEFYSKLMEETKREGDIRITIPENDSFNVGQLVYFVLMIGSIYSYIEKENPYDRNLINKIKGELSYNKIIQDN